MARPRPDLPPGQLRLYVALLAYTQAHGRPPALRDLMAATGIRSQNGVRQHLDALRRKGLLTRDGVRTARPLYRLELWA